MTLFLFVIMLIGVDKTHRPHRDDSFPAAHRLRPGCRPLVALIGVAVLDVAAAFDGSLEVAWTTGRPSGICTLDCVGTIENISGELFTGWLLPFEATVLLLTIAAVGTVALGQFALKARDDVAGGSRMIPVLAQR